MPASPRFSVHLTDRQLDLLRYCLVKRNEACSLRHCCGALLYAEFKGNRKRAQSDTLQGESSKVHKCKMFYWPHVGIALRYLLERGRVHAFRTTHVRMTTIKRYDANKYEQQHNQTGETITVALFQSLPLHDLGKVVHSNKATTIYS